MRSGNNSQNARILLLYLACSCTFILYAQSNHTQYLLFNRNTSSIFVSGGNGGKIIDRARLDESNQVYYRSPTIAIGMDRCVIFIESSEYWSLGFLQTWNLTKADQARDQNSSRFLVSQGLSLLRFNHHLAFHFMKRTEISSGLSLGANWKYYHYNYFNDVPLKGSDNVLPALAATAMIRHYFKHNFGIYGELNIGLNVKLALLGVVYKPK